MKCCSAAKFNWIEGETSMFGQFSEQLKNSTQPASELLATNIKAMETVTKQQTQFFSGLVDDSVKLMQSIAKQTEINDVLAAQAVYAESIRERLTSTISSVSQQYTDAVKSGYEAMSKTTQETVKPATTKKVPAKVGPVVKVESVVKDTAVTKVLPTNSMKAASVLTETPTTAENPINVTAKTATKTKKVVVKKSVGKTLIKEQPAPKTAAKAIAMLSAEEVKAPAETITTDVTTLTDNKSAPVTKA